MNPNIVKKSKKLSWLLRHGAGEEGLPMDDAGWVPVEAVLRRLRMSRPTLEAVVAQNNKRRLQLEGDRVRCCQGHSLAGMPVTREGLERSWTLWRGGTVWHGTRVDAVESILEQGILPIARTHVHLAPSTNSVVGKRAAVGVLMGVDPARLRAEGIEVYAAPNGVVLCRRVPPRCITRLTHVSRRAKAQAARHDALLKSVLAQAG